MEDPERAVPPVVAVAGQVEQVVEDPAQAASAEAAARPAAESRSPAVVAAVMVVVPSVEAQRGSTQAEEAAGGAERRPSAVTAAARLHGRKRTDGVRLLRGSPAGAGESWLPPSHRSCLFIRDGRSIA